MSKNNKKSITNSIPGAQPMALKMSFIGPLIKLIQQWLQIQVSIDDDPIGKRLGTIDVPAINLNLYLNLIIRLWGLTLLSGYFELK